MNLLNSILLEGTIELEPEIIKDELFLVIRNGKHLYTLVIKELKHIARVACLKLRTLVRITGSLQGNYIFIESIDVIIRS